MIIRTLKILIIIKNLVEHVYSLQTDKVLKLFINKNNFSLS